MHTHTHAHTHGHAHTHAGWGSVDSGTHLWFVLYPCKTLNVYDISVYWHRHLIYCTQTSTVSLMSKVSIRRLMDFGSLRSQQFSHIKEEKVQVEAAGVTLSSSRFLTREFVIVGPNASFVCPDTCVLPAKPRVSLGSILVGWTTVWKVGKKTGSGAGDGGAESMPVNVNMLVPIFINTENNQVYLPQFSASFHMGIQWSFHFQNHQ